MYLIVMQHKHKHQPNLFFTDLLPVAKLPKVSPASDLPTEIFYQSNDQIK